MFPIYFPDDMAVEELRDILSSAGYHLQSDNAGRTIATPLPPFLRRDQQEVGHA